MENKDEETNSTMDLPPSASERLDNKQSTLPLYITVPNSSEHLEHISSPLNVDVTSTNSISDAESTTTKMDVELPQDDSTKALENDNETLSTNSEGNSSEIILSEANSLREKKLEFLSDTINLQSPKSDSGGVSKPKISRELKGLQKAAAESKIITEFTNITEKMRSRKTLNSPNMSRSTDGGRKSADILKKDDTGRSSTDLTHGSKSNGRDNDESKSPKTIRTKLDIKTPSESKKLTKSPSKGNNNDRFCWQCHKDGTVIPCKTCPRSFHIRCIKGSNEAEDWCCPECVAIIQAETTDTRSHAMKQMSLGHLCELLKFALQRMTDYVGAEPFLNPVDEVEFPDYSKYVVHPMDLSQLGCNIKRNLYGSTEAFIADTKWILHNSVIYNSFHTKVTSVAKGIIKVCKQEMNEIETCPECYLKANTQVDTNWFLEVCTQPHMLVWAKLKGYPYWPAKAMTISSNGLVDVRFFGAHDKAWIPVKDCLLYSERDPNFSDKGKRADFVESVKELGTYIKNLEKKFGKFHYAPFKTPYPTDQAAVYNMMLPSYKYKLSDVKKVKDIKAIPVKSKSKKTLANSAEKNSDKSQISQDEDSFLDGYGTEDDEMPNILQNDSTAPVTSDGDASVLFSPLRGIVKMRGGKTNASGRIKILKIVKSPEGQKVVIKDDSNNGIPKLSPQDEKTQKSVLNFTIGKRKITSQPASEEKKQKQNDNSTGVFIRTFVKTGKTNIIMSTTEDHVEMDSVIHDKSEDVPIKPDKPKVDASVEQENNIVNKNRKEAEPDGEIKSIRPFKIMEKMPQLSIKLPKGVTLEKKSESSITKDDEKSAVKRLVLLKKRSHIETNADKNGGKNDNKTMNGNVTKRVKKSPDNTPVAESKVSMSLENLERFEKNMNIEQQAEKSNADSSKENMEIVVTDIKIEPLDYDELEQNNTDCVNTPTTPQGEHIITEVQQNDESNKNSIKNSARKTFPGVKPNTSENPSMRKSTTKTTLSGMVPNPISMVYIPQGNMVVTKKENELPRKEISMLNPQEKETTIVNSHIPLNYQLPLAGVGTFTTSRSSEVTGTTTSKNSVSASMSSREMSVGVVMPETNVVTDASTTIRQQLPSLALNPISTVGPTHSSASSTQSRALFGPLSAAVSGHFPSECGPITKLLNENAFKLSDYFRNLLQETLVDFSNIGSSDAVIKKLQAEVESLKWLHKQELCELKHNTELVLWEMRSSFEIANARSLAEYRKQAEAERIRSVQEAKSKQWCVNCGKEAQFYCCWNTSYCDYDCQREHWHSHMTLCGQHRDGSREESSPSHITKDGKVKNKSNPLVNRTTGNMQKVTPKLKQNIHSNNKTTSTQMRQHLTLIQTGQRHFEFVGKNKLINQSNILLNNKSKNIMNITSNAT